MYTVLDFETTGLDHNKDQVIQVGLVKLDKNFEVVSEYSSFARLNEGNKLSDFIVDYTGITEDMLSGCRSEHEVLEETRKIIGDDIVIAQFASFDLGFAPFGNDVNFICTKTIHMCTHPLLSSSLKDIVAHYNIQPRKSHNALEDAYMTAEVFSKMREYYGGLHRFLNVMKKPADRDLRFVPDRAVVIDDESYF